MDILYSKDIHCISQTRLDNNFIKFYIKHIGALTLLLSQHLYLD